MSFDFAVPGNGFLAAGLRVGPDGMAAAFANRHAAMFLKMAEATPDVSCQHQFRRFRLGIEPENFFAFGFQQEFNGFLEVGQTFFLGLSLAIRAGNFQAGRPKTAFVRLALMNDGREYLHAPCSAFPGGNG